MSFSLLVCLLFHTLTRTRAHNTLTNTLHSHLPRTACKTSASRSDRVARHSCMATRFSSGTSTRTSSSGLFSTPTPSSFPPHMFPLFHRVSTSRTSVLESKAMLVDLAEQSEGACFFKIMPRFPLPSPPFSISLLLTTTTLPPSSGSRSAARATLYMLVTKCCCSLTRLMASISPQALDRFQRTTSTSESSVNLM